MLIIAVCCLGSAFNNHYGSAYLNSCEYEAGSLEVVQKLRGAVGNGSGVVPEYLIDVKDKGVYQVDGERWEFLQVGHVYSAQVRGNVILRVNHDRTAK
jgi:hypothetical protein